MGWGGRLFEAGRLLTFSAFSMGAYSRWALILDWALVRINLYFANVNDPHYVHVDFCFQRLKEAEDTFASREKDYQAQLEEYKEFEQKAKDKIRDMENRLEQTTFDRENYKAQLSGNDGRISALESQLARVEAMKNDTEFKLSSLYSILRRSLGLRSGSQSSFSEEDSPKKNRRSFRGRSRSNSGTGTSIFL